MYYRLFWISSLFDLFLFPDILLAHFWHIKPINMTFKMPKINMMKMLPQTQWRPSSRSATMKELHAGEKSATRPLQWEQNQPMHGPRTLRGIKHQQCLCVSQYTKCPKNASPATTGVPSVPKVWKVLQQRRTVSVSRCLPPHPHLAQVCLLNLQLNRWRHFKCVGNVKSTGWKKRALLHNNPRKLYVDFTWVSLHHNAVLRS